MRRRCRNELWLSRGRTFQMEALRVQRTLGWTRVTRSKKSHVASGVSEGSGKRGGRCEGSCVQPGFSPREVTGGL